MKKLKKVISGVAAVAALVAVPTATAMAESTGISSETSVLSEDSYAGPTQFSLGQIVVDLPEMNPAQSSTEISKTVDVCLDTIDFMSPSTSVAPGYTFSYDSEIIRGKNVIVTYTLRDSDTTEVVYRYDVTFTSTAENCDVDDDQDEEEYTGLSEMSIDGIPVDMENLTATTDRCLSSVDFTAISSAYPSDYTLSYDSEVIDGADGTVTVTYALRNKSDGSLFKRYDVTFTSTAENCDVEATEASVTSFVIDHNYLVYGENLEAAATSDGYTFYVDSLDGITGEVTDIAAKGSLSTPSCSTNTNNTKMTCTYSLYDSEGNRTDQLYTVNFVVSDEETDVAEPSVTSFEINYKYLLQDADLAEAATSDGYTFEVESLDGIDGTVTGSAISNDGELSGPACSTDADGTQMTCTYSLYRSDGTRTDQLFTVHFVVVADGDTGEGDSGEGDNTGDDNTGDDTTDGDDTVDEDDTTGDAENPSDDESDTDDTDDTEATSDEESESDDTSTLATTGSALLGIGVFALVALIGAGVVYTVRKRA